MTGTLTGFTKDRHTDRAKVTGTPLVECPVVDKDPFGDASGKPSTGGEAGDGDGPRQVTVGDRTLCEDTPVESNTDDWNGRRSLLGETGSAILPRRRGRAAHGRHRRRRRDGPPPQVGA
ncbi:hypothetical protein ACTGNK_08925 [Bifidobacterium longum]